MAKKPRNAVAKFLPELLLTGGAALVILSTSHKLLQKRALSVSEQVVTQYLEQPEVKEEVSNYPVHITIPWYVDVDIDPQTFVSGEWTVSPDHASFLTDSTIPGHPGNIILYGHNKRPILGNIRALKGYEKITLKLIDGTERVYQIQSLTQVSPSNTALLAPTEEETLTIYTCAGFMDSQRFVVRAVPISEQPNPSE